MSEEAQLSPFFQDQQTLLPEHFDGDQDQRCEGHSLEMIVCGAFHKN